MSIKVDWAVVCGILAIKVLVFAFGALAYQALANERVTSWEGFLTLWNRWDAPHFLTIAQKGYDVWTEHGHRAILLVFPPLFPALVRLVAVVLGGNYQVGILLVSTLASVAAGLLLNELVRFDEQAQVARRAVWFMFIFPTAFFLHIGYADSLFLALVLACFVSARTGQWALAGILGSLACLTRVNGVLLMPALLVEAFHQYRQQRQWRWGWLWIAAVAGGLGAFLAVNYLVVGDPFYYFTLQKEHFVHRTVAFPWVGIWETWKAVSWRAPSDAHMIGIQELVFVGLGFVATIISLLRLRPSYTVWMAASWLFTTSMGFLICNPRYALALFPLFMIFATVSKNPVVFAFLTAWSLLFQGLFVAMFVQGRWVA